ncbi:MAG: RNase adapter RapZ [Acidobacteria bacterium]|nr:RNase adapter RapZ [Acidobacteriota bacterium]MBU1338340.1 RNase adapter RapZ [Acidobacteriota bacterium]MBU1475515.1 RNase adapter RapZ [Acidobacteriota bacterium]MBU2438426.1 RNase adapter RapZ [Acidobacteriota bacterium]
MKEDRFLIITGQSGSGKSCVSRFLEDLGYYCIDNLPVKLIPTLVDLWSRREVEIDKVALVIDIRESSFVQKFPAVLEEIKTKVNPTILFLEASDKALIKRFSESRRPHPLSSQKSMAEVIAAERESLADIKGMADEVIDTTESTVSQLKEILTERFSGRKGQPMRVVVVSFGYKYGLPLDSDLVFDARCLPNPFYIDRLREKTGMMRSVRNYVLKFEETAAFLEAIQAFIDYMMPCFVKEGKSHVTISIGCTGGRHRSVVLSDVIHKHLQTRGFKSSIYHRDIYK